MGMPSGGTSTVELMMLASGHWLTDPPLSRRPRRRSERLNGSCPPSAASACVVREYPSASHAATQLVSIHSGFRRHSPASDHRSQSEAVVAVVAVAAVVVVSQSACSSRRLPPVALVVSQRPEPLSDPLPASATASETPEAVSGS